MNERIDPETLVNKSYKYVHLIGFRLQGSSHATFKTEECVCVCVCKWKFVSIHKLISVV